MEPVQIYKCRYCGHPFKNKRFWKNHEWRCCANQKKSCDFCPWSIPEGYCPPNKKQTRKCLRKFEIRLNIDIRCVYFVSRIDPKNQSKFTSL